MKLSVTAPLIVVGLAILAGCTNTTGTAIPVSVEGPVAAVIVPSDKSSVGPGPAVVDGAMAAELFADICGSTYPNLKAATAKLAKGPYRQQPQTGTWYHRDLDLSFKIIPEQRACSQVFGTQDDAGPLGLLYAVSVSSTDKVAIDPASNATMTSGPHGSVFEFAVTGKVRGRSYIHAVLYGRR